MGHIADCVCGVIYEVAVPCGDGSFEMILLEAFWIDRSVKIFWLSDIEGEVRDEVLY